MAKTPEQVQAERAYEQFQAHQQANQAKPKKWVVVYDAIGDDFYVHEGDYAGSVACVLCIRYTQAEAEAMRDSATHTLCLIRHAERNNDE